MRRLGVRSWSHSVVEADTAPPVQLLADLRDLFATTSAATLATATILRHLAALTDRPWAAPRPHSTL